MITLLSSNVLPDEALWSLESLGLFNLSAFAGNEDIGNALPGSMLSRFVEHSLEGVLLRLAKGQLSVPELVAPLRAQLMDRVRMMGPCEKWSQGRRASSCSYSQRWTLSRRKISVA